MSSISYSMKGFIIYSIVLFILSTNVESGAEKENHCQLVADFQVKDVDLDQMVGKWFGQMVSTQYTTIPVPKDHWAVIEKNHLVKSNFTHILKMIIDDKVLILSMKINANKNIVMRDENNPAMDEIQSAFLDLEYHSFFMMFLCHDLQGVYSLFPKYGVFTRSRILSDSVRDRAKDEAEVIRQADKLRMVKSANCNRG